MWRGDSFMPMSYNLWVYANANPVRYVDPSGMISCEDSSDPACIIYTYELYEEAISVKNSVMSGEMLPVEGFATLVDEAYVLSDYDVDGMMYGLSNVLIAIDPNNHLFVTVAGGWQDATWNNKLDYVVSDEDKYYVREDFLLYGNPSELHIYNRTTDERRVYSEIGDWDPRYFDMSANQAYHFWFAASSAYYDGDALAHAANLFHDPYYLEGKCGPDLIKWKDSSNSIKNFWAMNVGGTSRQDFNLSVKGIQFGNMLQMPGYGLYARFVSPGDWIRNNLKED